MSGKMLEHAEYCGNYYGTPKEPIEKAVKDGFDIVLEIEVQGGAQIKKKFLIVYLFSSHRLPWRFSKRD